PLHEDDVARQRHVEAGTTVPAEDVDAGSAAWTIAEAEIAAVRAGVPLQRVDDAVALRTFRDVLDRHVLSHIASLARVNRTIRTFLPDSLATSCANRFILSATLFRPLISCTDPRPGRIDATIPSPVSSSDRKAYSSMIAF